MPKFSKNTIVRNYLKRFPKTPSLTLAKKIYAENVESFNDVENARTIIRYCRGLTGHAHKKTPPERREFFVKPFELNRNPFSLPKSDQEKAKVFHLPKSCNNVLVLSDLHVPYHDIPSITTALQYGKDHNINCIFLNGDLIDFFQISRFTNTVRRRSVQEELDLVKQFLAVLNKEFPNIPIYFLKGNHDIRIETYLAVKAPELLDCEDFKLHSLLELEKYGVQILEDNTLVKMGKLNVTHGHLLIRGVFAPVNSARGAFLKAKASVLIGHVHKISTHSETTITGKTITCYSTGCLCELNPLYSPFGNNYTHGFAHVVVQPNGHYKVRNIQLIDGQIV